MRVAELVINVSDISDACTLGENATVSGIFSFAEEIVNQGGRIVLQRQCVNAAPQILAIYATLDDVRAWKEKLNDIQSLLGRHEIL